MTEPLTPRDLVALRKVTRVLADALRATLLEHLGTLAPLLHPSAVLGEFLEDDPQEGRRHDPQKGVRVRLLRLNPVPQGGSPHAAASHSFLPAMAGGRSKQVNRDLQTLYAKVASTKLYSLSPELEPPIQITGSSLEIQPLEYQHVVRTARGESKTIVVTSPLKWVLYYAGFPPAGLSQLLNDRNRSSHALQSFVLHTLIMGAASSPSTGIGELLEGLRFPAAPLELSEFGTLPLTVVSTAVSTFRPPDQLILESTEISGRSAFEEVVQLEDVHSLRDPWKTELLRIVRETAPELLEKKRREPVEKPAPPPPQRRPPVRAGSGRKRR